MMVFWFCYNLFFACYNWTNGHLFLASLSGILAVACLASMLIQLYFWWEERHEV